jgi:hypothetical protein
MKKLTLEAQKDLDLQLMLMEVREYVKHETEFEANSGGLMRFIDNQAISYCASNKCGFDAYDTEQISDQIFLLMKC